MHDLAAFLHPTSPKMPFQWPGSLSLAALNPIPRKYRPGRRRSRQKFREDDPSDDYDGLDIDIPRSERITRLQTSLNPLISLRALRRHRWSLLDLNYVAMAGFIIFSLAILPPAPLAKTLAVLGGLLLLLMPITRQFFLSGLPIWTYLIYFFCSRYIPVEYRPHIWVRVLPALENVLYGANLSNILSAHTHPVLDILAWIPYGLGHFGAPAICSLAMFFFAAPGTTPVFAKAFGWQSVLGVTLQLMFPCTPPWYENEHGLAPAAYGMQGSPAGLARVDAILGVDMYTTSFTTAPVPFGAFPSLHAADAILEALFMSYCFPRLRPLFLVYVAWILWATMYLSHHYAVDLVAGGLIAVSFYYVARTRFLPQRQPGKRSRWEYEYVEIGEMRHRADEEYGSSGFQQPFGLKVLRRRETSDSDEWTLGSSSGATFSESSGTVSPALVDGEGRRSGLFFAEMTPQGHFWEGGMARENEVSEVVLVR